MHSFYSTPNTYRITTKGSKKIVEELLTHMVVNSFDAPKKTNNNDVERAASRLHTETRPLGQPAGEAASVVITVQRGFQPGNVKKKVGGAKGDEMVKFDNRSDTARM